jgi:hypothetical protein
VLPYEEDIQIRFGPQVRNKEMNGLTEVVAQIGAIVLSILLGLLIGWGSLVWFFRAFFSPEQAERLSILQDKSPGPENAAPHV